MDMCRPTRMRHGILPVEECSNHLIEEVGQISSRESRSPHGNLSQLHLI